MTDKQALYRMIPAVDQLLSAPRIRTLMAAYPRSLVRRAIDRILDDARDSIAKGRVEDDAVLGRDAILSRIAVLLPRMDRPALRPVINATGVVVHTNLGRSLLAERVLRRFRSVAGGYSNLEYDLEQGKRGSRYVHVEGILKELTSTEAAMVVNNNAAAVLVALETLAKGREVIVSRGQLVEIGGSFRVPDVMRKSGAVMVEVGTTNKTHLRDYEEVIGPDTGLLLKVHTSNYQILGFTHEVPLSELSRLGRRYGIPVMEDLGSGCLVDFSRFGLQGEPTVQEALAQGADLVTFSGDKLLGGPQAGIILGRKDLVDAIRRNQLNRALRIDKLTLLALEETLRAYRDMDAAVREVPTLRMICQSYATLARKAERLVRMVGKTAEDNFTLELVDGSSRVGGGALPTLALPTRLVSLAPKRLSAQRMESWLRDHDPPVISRLEKDCLLMDVRTIQERELRIAAMAIRDLAGLGGEP
jgi:L-seryl-tRNA(Ser) seleniumtransferase